MTTAKPIREFVFEMSEKFAQCHASTLARLPNGDIVSAWFGGTKEAAPDTGIWWATRHNGVWSAPDLLVKIGPEAHWNPVLFVDEKEELHLYFRVGEHPWDWRTYHMVRSNKKRQQWSSPKRFSRWALKAPDHGPVRSKPIILSDGTWLAPGSQERIVYGVAKKQVVWRAFVDWSTNRGKKWKSADIPIDEAIYGHFGGVIQPTLWESSPGYAHMFLRSTYGVICRSDSTDYGRTWSSVESTGIPNNNSGVDVTKTDSGLLVLVYNPVSGNWAARTPMSLSFSLNDGRVWTKPVHLERGAGAYAYPSIISIPGGVALTYTWNRRRIGYWEIQLTNLGTEENGSPRVGHNIIPYFNQFSNGGEQLAV